jgi:predicted thioesterase
MGIEIAIGTAGNETMVVELKDTAKALGSGLAEVFATPAMIAFMESTAYRSIERFLPQGFSTVGIQIDVKHMKATLPGAIVKCESTVTKQDGNKVSFTIQAFEGEKQIGEAIHTRYIIDEIEFMSKLRS